VRTFLLSVACVLCGGLGLGTSAALHASPQNPATSASTSLDEIRDRLDKPPALRAELKEPVQLRPTFKSEVERHPWVLTLEQELHKEFDLNAFQRQSAEWRSKCCGIALGPVLDAISKARRNAEVSKVRAQIRRELAELEAARAAAATAK
jgi:hypothetical protein